MTDRKTQLKRHHDDVVGLPNNDKVSKIESNDNKVKMKRTVIIEQQLIKDTDDMALDGILKQGNATQCHITDSLPERYVKLGKALGSAGQKMMMTGNCENQLVHSLRMVERGFEFTGPPQTSDNPDKQGSIKSSDEMVLDKKQKEFPKEELKTSVVSSNPVTSTMGFKVVEKIVKQLVVYNALRRVEQSGCGNEHQSFPDHEMEPNDASVNDVEQLAEAVDAEQEDFLNKRGAIMDFLSLLYTDSETVTTSLFCCIANHYINKNKEQRNVFRVALDMMMPAIIAVMKPSKLDGFGSIYPEDEEIFIQLEQFYNVGIHIYEQNGSTYRHPSNFRCGNYDSESIDVMFTQSSNCDRYLHVLNIDSLGNRYTCTYCDKTYFRQKDLYQHLKRGCWAKLELNKTGILPDPHDKIELVCKQGIWKPKMNIMEKLKEMNILILPEHENPLTSPFFTRDFIVWDIESFLEGIDEKDNPRTPHYKFLSSHKVAMIAYTNTMDFETKIFSSHPQNPSEFVEKFIISVLECQKRISVKHREEIKVYIEEIHKRIVIETKKGRIYWMNRYKSLLEALNNYVDKVVTLGWNTSKYDIPVLRSMGFFYYLEKHDKPIEALKKTGSKYIRVGSKHTIWLDFLLFQGPKVPLRKFLMQFENVSTEKDNFVKEFFPYGCLTSHKALDAPLPSLEDFYDTLTKRNQLLTDERMKFDQVVERHKGCVKTALMELGSEKEPESPQQKYNIIRAFWERNGFLTVRDILHSYIRADVVPLAKAIQLSLHLYHSQSIDLLKDFVSLPSFVLHYAMKYVANPRDDFFCLLMKEERELIGDYLLGGPSIIFTRYCKVGESKLKPHDFTNPQTARRIIGFDQTAMYGGNMTKDMFVGHYAVRDRETMFEPKLMGAHRHDAILYVEYFAFRNNIPNVRHVASSHGLGEKWIKIGSGLIRVDGYATMVDSDGNFRKIVLEYHEENYSHGFCSKCQTPERNARIFHGNGKSMLELYKLTMQRMDKIEEAGYEVHYIWGCEFDRAKQTPEFRSFEKYHFNLGPNITQRNLTESEALQQIFTGEINGFVQLSAKVEERDRKYFCDYPPLFSHLEITRDMLVPKMRDYATKYGHFDTKQKLLVSSFFVKKQVMSTTYARFLLGIGVTLYDVKKIIQFRSSPCLAPFIRTMVERRKDGDRTNNPLLSDWAKSAINNCFGYSIMDEKKRTTTKFMNYDKVPRAFMNRAVVVDHTNAGHPDAVDELVELTVKPSKITLKTPIQIGSEILWRGKLELMSFVYDIIKANIKPDHYEFLLTDTDSVYLAIGGNSLDDCVKEGKETEWKRIKHDHFTDESTEERSIATKRTPHYWHIEKQSDGVLIALSSKLYIITDNQGKTVKSGSKGIQKRNNSQLLTEKVFEAVLLDKIDSLPEIINTGFIQKNHQILTYELLKSSLHACYGKRGVYDCGIHTFTYPNF